MTFSAPPSSQGVVWCIRPRRSRPLSTEMEINTALLCSAVLVTWCVSPSAGFIPTRLLAFSVNAISLSFDDATTHAEMSRAAILQVAASVLTDNPNPDSEGSSDRIAALTSRSEENLVTAYYGTRQRSITSTFRDVIRTITDANADVDLGGEELDAAAHFDSEQIQAGHNRLVDIRQTIVTQISLSNFETAREETGRLLHTLQDFYSHSNWIENGNRAPYRVLGRSNERPTNIAGSTTRTCTDCEGSRTLFDISINFFNLFTLEIRPFECSDNIVTTLLTTGYFEGQRDASGQVIAKPTGKCSHGGFLDETSEQDARGGINKDSLSNIFSPHHFLHDEAARVAQQATADILLEIRREVNDDTLFGMYLGLDVAQGISIAYVIDIAESMAAELVEIEATIPGIRDSLQQAAESFSGLMNIHYLLLPFTNDSGTFSETEDIATFQANIAALRTEGGGDRTSIGAIIRAMEASEPGSPVYVFTDAPASDGDRLNEARAVILRTEVRIYFVLSNFVGDQSVYEELAGVSGGQVLNVGTNDISEVSSLVSFSSLQSRSTILRASSSTDGAVVHVFPVDSSIVEVVLSTSGQNISVSVISPQGVDSDSVSEFSTSLVSTTSYIARVSTTENSLRGEWRVTIQSQGSYSIQVLGNSELSFSQELYKIDASNMFGFRDIQGRPLRGQPLITMIEVGGSNTHTASGINLVSPSGMILQSVQNFSMMGQDSYMGVFMPPSEPFALQLVGTDQNGLGFSHITDTSIEVSDIDLTLSGSSSGFITLRPGQNATITLTLLNNGADADFALSAVAAALGSAASIESLQYAVIPSTTSLRQRSSTEATVMISLSNDVIDGLTVVLTVFADTMDGSDNDFITFHVDTTTRPPPQFTENDSFNGAVMPTPLLLLEGMVIMGFLLVC